MFLTWFGSEAGPLCLPVLLMFLHTDSLSTFLPLSLCHLAALRWTLPVTTVLQIAELWFLHMQIMQCFHTNIDRAKLVDSQSVFVFSLGGLDSSQFLLLEIDKISDVKHQLFFDKCSTDFLTGLGGQKVCLEQLIVKFWYSLFREEI